MTRVISIDPGLARVAYAIWEAETGKLLRAGLVRKEHEVGTERVQKWANMAWAVDDELGLSNGEEIWLVLEVPQVYKETQNRDKKGHGRDPNDLIDLAGVLGAIAGKLLVGRVEWSPLPREWKGQLPKEITKKRVDERLAPAERETVEWPSVKEFHKDVYDAIHLGIVYLESEGYREIPLPVRYPNKPLP